MINNVNFLLDCSENKFPWSLIHFEHGKKIVDMVYYPLDKNGYPIVIADLANPKINEYRAGRAVVDTGANRSLIKHSVYVALKLSVHPESATASSGGSVDLIKYLGYADLNVSIKAVMGETVMSYTVLVEQPVPEGKIDNRPWDMLLGADFLQICNLEYKGGERQFGLELVTPPKE